MKAPLHNLCRQDNPSKQHTSSHISNTFESNIQTAAKNVLGQQNREKIKSWSYDRLDSGLQVNVDLLKITKMSIKH